jgi:hypothetical protein
MTLTNVAEQDAIRTAIDALRVSAINQPYLFIFVWDSAQFRTVLYSSAQFRTVPHSSVQFRTVPHSSVQFRTVPHSSVQFRTVPYSSAHFRTVPHSSVQFRTVPHSSAQFRTVPHSSVRGLARLYGICERVVVKVPFRSTHLRRLGGFQVRSPETMREDMVEPLIRGMASHHAGLLPAWKSLVERLFQQVD